MVVSEADVKNIMGGMQETSGVRINNKHKLRHRFDIVKKLGQGTYGKVQLAINKETGQDVAIKTIKKARIETEKDLIRIRREIQIMSSVTHPHIIHIYEVFENRDKMVLVMEYAAGGELYDYLSERKVLTDEEARRIFRQVASACYYCHKHKICHRDLKLENILLDEFGNAKIADFGLSNVFDESRVLSTYCGSPLYASPEIVRGTPYTGPEVDCWSLGVLLYTLVYGAMPFDGSNFKKLVKQITAGDFYEPPKLSTASELVHALLTPAPDQRATMLDVCGHWWVNQNEEASCLDLAEELANQTPVRLDLLLSLAPREPDKEHVMALAGDQAILPEPSGAARKDFTNSDSLSLNSAMELDPASSPGPPPNSPRPSETETAAPEKPAKRALDDAEEAAASARKSEKAKGEKAAKKKKKKPQVASEPAVPSLAGHDVPMGDIVEEAETHEGEPAPPQAKSTPSLAVAGDSPGVTSSERVKTPAASPAKDVTPKAAPEPAEPAAVEPVVPPVAAEAAAPAVPAPDSTPAVPEAEAAPADISGDAAEQKKETDTSVPPASPSRGSAEVSKLTPAAEEAKKSANEKASILDDKVSHPNQHKAGETPTKSLSDVKAEPSEHIVPEEKPRRKSYVKYAPKDAPEPCSPASKQVDDSLKNDASKLSQEPASPKSQKETLPEASQETSPVAVEEAEKPRKAEAPGDEEVKTSPAKPKASKLSRPSPPKHDCLGISTPKKDSLPAEAEKPAHAAKTKPVKPLDASPEPEPAKTPTVKASGEDAVPTRVPPEPPAPTPEHSRVSPPKTSEEPAPKATEALSKPAPKAKAKSPQPESKPKDRVIQPKPSLHIDDVRRRSASREPADTVSSEPRPAAEATRPSTQPEQDRLAGEGRPSPAPEDAPRSQPPKRAPSKEYIIPIQLTSDEPARKDATAKPAADAKPETAPAERGAPAAPKPAAEARRPGKAVSTTSSLHSLPERESSSGEEDEDRDVTSSGDTLTSQRPHQALLTRSSRREFIIPIALEGGGVMTPPPSLASADTERKQGASLFRTHQLGGPRRIGSLLGERSIAGEEPWPAPWGGLKRVSSMRDFDDRPLTGLSSSWSSGARRLSRPRLSGSGERADSQSSGGEDEDDDDQFELFTADSLFGSLMDRVKKMSRRRAGDDAAGKRSFLLSEPMRLSQTGLAGPRPRLPSLFGAHGQVRSLFDQPMTFKHGSLFDQPPFARHSSLGSQSVGESSDSGSQQEDNSDPEQGRPRTRVKTVKRTTTPQGTRTVTTITTVKPKARSQSQADM